MTKTIPIRLYSASNSKTPIFTKQERQTTPRIVSQVGFPIPLSPTTSPRLSPIQPSPNSTSSEDLNEEYLLKIGEVEVPFSTDTLRQLSLQYLGETKEFLLDAGDVSVNIHVLNMGRVVSIKKVEVLK